jgi:hypothetical protein
MTERDIDKHSVNCYFCNKLVDDRECIPADEFNDGDGGEMCPECAKKRRNENTPTIAAYLYKPAIFRNHVSAYESRGY